MENLDCLSQKITFRFYINPNTKMEKQSTSAVNYKRLADIEGLFQIYLNNQLFFDDPYILLLELGLQLFRWRKKASYKEFEDFSFKTMDYDEDPILLLKKGVKENKWKISSIWQLFESDEEIDHELLLNEVDDFLNKLEKELFESFNLNFKEYLYNA